MRSQDRLLTQILPDRVDWDLLRRVGRKELWEIGVLKNIATSKEAFIELQNKEYIRFEDMPLEKKQEIQSMLNL
jgi:hypothetical protein